VGNHHVFVSRLEPYYFVQAVFKLVVLKDVLLKPLYLKLYLLFKPSDVFALNIELQLQLFLFVN